VDKIDHVFNTEIVEITGDSMPERVVFKNNVTGELMEYDANKEGPFGVFVFAGYVPNTKWLPKSVELDPQGYIVTDRDQKTSLDGVYAAGDVCVKNLRQVVTAVADGAIAATAAEKHVADMHVKLNIPEFEVKAAAAVEEPAKPAEATPKTSGGNHGFFDAQMRASLAGVFARFENPVLIKAWLDHSALSGEITGFLNEVVSMTDKVTWVKGAGEGPEHIPSIEVCKADGTPTGIHFHGVPGGHEINSFVIALYNVAGPGQAVDSAVLDKINAVKQPVNLKLLVSLSCTNCPDTVMASQKIAALNENVSAEMFDINHFPEFKEKYKVMSVPCVILNEEKLVFGKKNISEMADILSDYIR
jgi:thioredoxin reductase (NADPH)